MGGIDMRQQARPGMMTGTGLAKQIMDFFFDISRQEWPALFQLGMTCTQQLPACHSAKALV